MDRRLDIPPVAGARLAALERELGVSPALAQVLARRGLGEPDAARAWLAAADRHDPGLFAGIDEAVALVRRHVAEGTRITVHGDYDVDGVCSTAILVRALRSLGADVDWHLPSRQGDGYGLSAATVERLAARGTKLLVTADCAITAVEEVALARTLGLDVVVTDHHTPRADGALPDAPIVHPGVRGYPCPELCAAGVVHKLVEALGADAQADLDLVALATVADCVPLVGENRRLVREGLAALRRTTKPGLRALARVGKADLSRADAKTIGFRLAPRLNAAGRLARADAALELVLTEDEARAERIAEELDRANGERRHVEQRILFEAEAQVATLGEQPAYVLWGDGWHPGVIGIVASRIAERHHRPTLLVALDGDQGTGSGRSIPAFDLLGGLDACAPHLLRHGGHRAAAGCTVERARLDALRAAFAAHAAAVLRPEDLVPVERVDAVVSGDELGLELAEELERLAPFGTANPEPTLLVPAARLEDCRPMGEGRHLRCSVVSGGVRARAVLFGQGSTLPAGCEDGPLDVTVDLEVNEWNGAVEPRLLLRSAQPVAPAPVEVVGEPLPGTPAWEAAVLAAARDGAALAQAAAVVDAVAVRDAAHEAALVGAAAGATATATAAPAHAERPDSLTPRGTTDVRPPATPPRGAERPDSLTPRGTTDVRPPATPPRGAERPDSLTPRGTTDVRLAAEARRELRDRRGGGAAGVIAALVATGEPVLVLAADAPARAAQIAARVGGCAIASWDALEADPSLSAGHHVVALDPPPHPDLLSIVRAGDPDRQAVQAWGDPELRYARDVLDRDLALRPALAALFRAVRDHGHDGLGATLGAWPAPAAGRAVRVLAELGLVDARGDRLAAVPGAPRTALERSATFRDAERRHREGLSWLTSATRRAA